MPTELPDINLQAIPWEGRAVILLDLDAFFASVEQLDHPEWRGKPVIVGGSATKRGVVSTCSYEARAYGVRSAMPSSTAARLCPDAIWTSGHFSRYKELSDAVMSIMQDESPYLQQVSIDEAFLDITPTAHVTEHPIAIAQRIQKRVDDLGISCSIGLGISKSVAKVASDMDKPHGLTVVFPGREESFLAPLPTKVMSGIGPVAQEKLARCGIRTLGDVVQADRSLLTPIFGKNTDMMIDRCKGSDTDPVVAGPAAKSISNELSFATDLHERSEIEAAIGSVAAKIARRLRTKNRYARAISLKVRYSNRELRTVQTPLETPSQDEFLFTKQLISLLDRLWQPGMALRLVGASAFDLVEVATNSAMQETLFDSTAFETDEAQDIEDVDTTLRHQQLSQATDTVRNRFGEQAVMYGRELRTQQNLTGSSSKNPADYKD